MKGKGPQKIVDRQTVIADDGYGDSMGQLVKNKLAFAFQDSADAAHHLLFEEPVTADKRNKGNSGGEQENLEEETDAKRFSQWKACNLYKNVSLNRSPVEYS